MPMKSREATIVAGIPAIAPPAFGPSLSEIIVKSAIQMLPVRNANKILIRNGSIIFKVLFPEFK